MKKTWRFFPIFLFLPFPLFSFAGQWHTVPLQNRSPQSLVADISGENIFYSMGVGCSLWKDVSGEPIDISSQLTDTGIDYSYGRFFYLSASGNKLLLQAVTDGEDSDFLISEDYGKTWELINSNQFPGSTRLFIDPFHPEVIFLIGEKNISITTDLMQSFSHVSINDYMIQRIFYSDQQWYIQFHRYDRMESTHYGQISPFLFQDNEWTIGDPVLHTHRDFGLSGAYIYDIFPLSNGKYLLSLDVDNLKENEEYQKGRLFILNKNWEIETRCGYEFPSYQAPYEFIESVKSPGVLFAQADRLYISSDNGKNWAPFSSKDLPENKLLSSKLFQQPETGDLFLSILGQGLFKSVDTGNTWKKLPVPLITGMNSLEICNNSIGIFNHSQYAYLFQNNKWQQLDLNDSDDKIVRLHEPFYINGDTLLLSVSSRKIDDNSTGSVKTIALSTDHGKTWSFEEGKGSLRFDAFQNDYIHYLISWSFEDSLMSISFDQGGNWQQVLKPSNMLVLSESGIYSTIKTEDSHYDLCLLPIEETTWKRLNLNLPAENRIAAIYPFGESIMVADQQRNCHWYFDGNWRELGQLPSYLYYAVRVIEEDGTLLVVAPQFTDSRIHVSRDTCRTWQDFSLDLPENYPTSRLVSLEYNEKQKQLWGSSLISPMWCDIKEVVDLEPGKFTIEANTPDEFNAYTCPFNSNIRIRYSTPSDGDVTINIVNEDSEKTSVVNGVKRRGIHYKYIDPTHIPTGRIYLEKITDPSLEAQKILIIKN